MAARGWFSVDGEELEDAWGVADRVPGPLEVDADEAVAWEERAGAPAITAP